jgi:DNA topoisomerase-3
VLQRQAFQLEITPGLASELLRNRATLEAHPLTVEGKPVFGKLRLQSDGSISHVPVEDRPAARESSRSHGASGKEALGTCPACGGNIIESGKGYGCGNWKSGCRFVIWKTIAGKKISTASVKKLLTSGETALLKGFKSRAGKPFSAKLKLEAGEVKFEFDSRPPR